MSDSQELAVSEKRELAGREEQTVPGRHFVPVTDVHETDAALTVVMEMPGVQKENVSVALENDTLRVEGRIDLSKYKGMEPLYTEYNIGHYARGFTLSGKIDRDNIAAQMSDGVLTLTLPKAREAMPRRISVN